MSMTQITLTKEQLRSLEDVRGPVRVLDADGRVLGQIDSPEFIKDLIEEVKRRRAAPEPCYTGNQVGARLRALQEEWNRTGGFDEAYMRQFLARLNEADPGHMPPAK